MIVKTPQKTNVIIKLEHSDFPTHLAHHLKLKFNRVFRNLHLFWNTSDFHEYINTLMMNPKDNLNRQGFPFEVIKELHKIHIEHDNKFPSFKKVDKWDILP